MLNNSPEQSCLSENLDISKFFSTSSKREVKPEYIMYSIPKFYLDRQNLF